MCDASEARSISNKSPSLGSAGPSIVRFRVTSAVTRSSGHCPSGTPLADSSTLRQVHASRSSGITLACLMAYFPSLDIIIRGCCSTDLTHLQVFPIISKKLEFTVAVTQMAPQRQIPDRQPPWL